MDDKDIQELNKLLTDEEATLAAETQQAKYRQMEMDRIQSRIEAVRKEKARLKEISDELHSQILKMTSVLNDEKDALDSLAAKRREMEKQYGVLRGELEIASKERAEENAKTDILQKEQASLQAEISRLEKEKEDIRARTEELLKKRGEVKSHEATLMEECSRLSKELESAVKELENANSEYSAVAGRRSYLELETASLKSRLEEMEKRVKSEEERCRQLRTEVDTAAAGVAELEKKEEEERAAAALLQAQLNEKKSTYDSIRMKIDFTRANASELKASIDSKEEVNKKLQAEMEALKETCAKREEKLAEIVKQNEMVQTEVVGLKGRLARLREGEYEALRERDRLSEEKNHLMEKESDLEQRISSQTLQNHALEKENQQKKERITRLAGEKEGLEKKAEELKADGEKLGADILELSRSIETLSLEIRKLGEEILEKKAEKIRKELTLAAEIERKERAQKEIMKLEEEIKSVEAMYTQEKADAERLEAEVPVKRSELEQRKSDLDKAVAEKRAIEEEIEKLRRLIIEHELRIKSTSEQTIALSSEKAALENRLNATKAELLEKEDKLKALKDEYAAKDAELKTVEKKCLEAEEGIASTNTELEAAVIKKDELEKRLQTLTKTLEDTRIELKKIKEKLPELRNEIATKEGEFAAVNTEYLDKKAQFEELSIKKDSFAKQLGELKMKLQTLLSTNEETLKKIETLSSNIEFTKEKLSDEQQKVNEMEIKEKQNREILEALRLQLESKIHKKIELMNSLNVQQEQINQLSAKLAASSEAASQKEEGSKGNQKELKAVSEWEGGARIDGQAAKSENIRGQLQQLSSAGTGVKDESGKSTEKPYYAPKEEPAQAIPAADRREEEGMSEEEINKLKLSLSSLLSEEQSAPDSSATQIQSEGSGTPGGAALQIDISQKAAELEKLRQMMLEKDQKTRKESFSSIPSYSPPSATATIPSTGQTVSSAGQTKAAGVAAGTTTMPITATATTPGGASSGTEMQIYPKSTLQSKIKWFSPSELTLYRRELQAKRNEHNTRPKKKVKRQNRSPAELIRFFSDTETRSLLIKGAKSTGKTILTFQLLEEIADFDNTFVLATAPVYSEEMLKRFPWLRRKVDENNLIDPDKDKIPKLGDSIEPVAGQPPLTKVSIEGILPYLQAGHLFPDIVRLYNEIEYILPEQSFVVIDQVEELCARYRIDPGTLVTMLQKDLVKKSRVNIIYTTEVMDNIIVEDNVDGVVELVHVKDQKEHFRQIHYIKLEGIEIVEPWEVFKIEECVFTVLKGIRIVK
ncbi:MAG: gas vesicle protein GvpD P-loop domain-containing protein [Thermoplasmata archaeon]